MGLQPKDDPLKQGRIGKKILMTFLKQGAVNFS